ncbi:MAG: CRISPR-associated endonuclease Cas2 [Anaerolineae bacterium]|nr:CRISPR-associated endonuclease Cas2 [Anaerolineae bacterium]
MEKRTFYLLSYDISSDKRRAKIAKIMESLGERVQGSVFEAWLNDQELDKLLRRVKKTFAEKEDSLRIYVICETCRPKVRTLGTGRLTPPPQVHIV